MRHAHDDGLNAETRRNIDDLLHSRDQDLAAFQTETLLWWPFLCQEVFEPKKRKLLLINSVNTHVLLMLWYIKKMIRKRRLSYLIIWGLREPPNYKFKSLYRLHLVCGNIWKLRNLNKIICHLKPHTTTDEGKIQKIKNNKMKSLFLYHFVFC